LAKICNHLGVLQEAEGRLHDALESLSRALAIWERLAREHTESTDFAMKRESVQDRIALVQRKRP
jgi:hypothetical protein